MVHVDVREILGIIAGILAIGGYIPYIISTLLRKTKPERASWIIWTIVGGILAFSYMATGDLKAIWLPFGYFFGPFIVMILSIWYGYSSWSKLDTFCIIAAILTLIPWFFYHEAIVTLLLNVLIDCLGAIPTIIKTYQEPDTEDLTAWIVFLIANTLQLFAITDWNLSAIYPIYLFVLASLIVLFIFKGKFIASSIKPQNESKKSGA